MGFMSIKISNNRSNFSEFPESLPDPLIYRDHLLFEPYLPEETL